MKKSIILATLFLSLQAIKTEGSSHLDVPIATEIKSLSTLTLKEISAITNIFHTPTLEEISAITKTFALEFPIMNSKNDQNGNTKITYSLFLPSGQALYELNIFKKGTLNELRRASIKNKNGYTRMIINYLPKNNTGSVINLKNDRCTSYYDDKTYQITLDRKKI